MGSPLPKQLLIILSVWLLMTGMAVLDVVDLSDEFAHPSVTWDQAIDPELEESDDESSGVAVALVSSAQSGGHVPLDFSARPRRCVPLDVGESRSLFQQFAQYRI